MFSYIFTNVNILRSVVSTIAIQVMDWLASFQFPPNLRLGNKTVFIGVTPTICQMVTNSDPNQYVTP